jgi:glyoxylate/hydroxypyruvate reductase A
MEAAPCTVLFHSTLDDPSEWIPRLSTLLPNETIRAWPDEGDPANIDLAVLWTQPPGGLERYPRLSFVQSLGAGVNQLELDVLPPRLRVARMVDPAMGPMMAEYCLTAVLRYHRRFDAHERSQRAGRWDFIPPVSPRHFPVGVMGVGELGAVTATALAAHGFPVRGWSSRPRSLSGVTCFAGHSELPAFLDGLAALVCLLPLTAQTRGILNAALFDRLPNGAYLINAGRGAHLVEADLLAALASGRLAGATLDVLHEEPPPSDHPFWRHERVLLTPHVAALADPDGAASLVADNIMRFRRSEPVLNEVDRMRGY